MTDNASPSSSSSSSPSGRSSSHLRLPVLEEFRSEDECIEVKRSLEVLSFWSEIELFSPPEFQSVDANRALRETWRSKIKMPHPQGETVEESASRKPMQWQEAFLREPYAYKRRTPTRLLSADIPAFTVYLGIVDLKTVYTRLLNVLRGVEHGAEECAVDKVNDALLGATFNFGDMRGKTFLATLQLNPWGKYIQDSFCVAGFVGGLRSLTCALKAQHATGAQNETPKTSPQKTFIEDVEDRLGRMGTWASNQIGTWLSASQKDDPTNEHFVLVQPVIDEARKAELARALTQVESSDNRDASDKLSSSSTASTSENPFVVGRGAFAGANDEWVELKDPAASLRPMTPEVLERLLATLSHSIGLPEDLTIAVETEMRYPFVHEAPELPCLRSFYLRELERAKKRIEKAGSYAFDAPGQRALERLAGAKDALKQLSFLRKGELARRSSEEALLPLERKRSPKSSAVKKGNSPTLSPAGAPLGRLLKWASTDGAKALPRLDLLEYPAVLAELLSPLKLPLGRWPASPKNHLFLAQQAAVSSILRAGEDFGPLVAVNGPPGTGKSWLIRDVVAEIVVRRAARIAKCTQPDEVFDKDHPVSFMLPNDESISFTPIADEIAKDGLIVVASSNNAAIRNITDMLPRSYELKPAVTDQRLGCTRPAFSFWRDAALGLLALNVEAEERDKAKRGLKTRRTRAVAASALERFTQGAKGQEEQELSEAESENPTLQSNMAFSMSPQVRLKRLLGRVPRAHEVWGLASATLGSRRNCKLFTRAVMGIGGKNPFNTTIEQLIRDAHEVSSERGEDWREKWTQAKTRFQKLFEEVKDRRRQITEHARHMCGEGNLPESFLQSLSAVPAQHKTSLWVDENFERLRSELFEAAMALHETTFIACPDEAIKGLRGVCTYLQCHEPRFLSGEPRQVFEFLSTVVPVISTTLASVPRLFAQIDSGELAWVFIDEAGQATPQSAVGMLDRAKRAVILGDPRQLMPVVTLPQPIVEILRSRHHLVARHWSPCESSLQTLADATMEVGARIADEVSGQPVWTGLPLRTHRRSLSPMFDVANKLSYGGQMVQMTPAVPIEPSLHSRWVDIVASGVSLLYVPTKRGKAAKGTLDEKRVVGRPLDIKVVRQEMAYLRMLLLELNDESAMAGQKVFILSPFRAVAMAAERLVAELKVSGVTLSIRAGTVHAFQGQEADMVILVLGSAPGMKGKRQRQWAASPSNLLNVAVTRAKKELIVIGDYAAWTIEPAFRILGDALPRERVEVDEEAEVFAREK